MRGDHIQQTAMFSYLSPEQRVPVDHPLRAIREFADGILDELSDMLDKMYSPTGRRSIAPEKLSRALLLQVLYSVRSERLLMEELNYNLLFRWFVGLNMDDAVWHPTVYSKNRDRLLEAEVARKFFDGVVTEATQLGLMSDEHFTVDGTLLEACASLKRHMGRQEIWDGFWRGSKSLIRTLWKWLTRHRTPGVPRETIRIVQDLVPLQCFWNNARMGDKSATRIEARFYATNITDKPVSIPQARLKSPPAQAVVLVRHPDPEYNVYGEYPLEPGRATPGSASFFIEPPICAKKGEDFKATLVLIDSFGNEHKKEMVFKNIPTPEQ